MDDRSYDDSEPMPEPSPRGPPPPQPQTRPLSPAITPEKSESEQDLFFDGVLNHYEDDDEEDLPPPPLVPPSPVSQPSASLFGDEDASPCQAQTQQRQQHQHYRTTPAPSSKLTGTNNQKPPMSEVLLNNEEDTFFEDRSLENRTRRSLEQSTPQTNKTVSVGLREQNSIASPQKQLQYPSSEDVARVHHNALQALIVLKAELMKANEKLHQVTNEKENISGERDQLRNQIKEQEMVSHSKVLSLESQVADLQQTSETLKSENEKMDVKARAALREKKEYMHKRLAWDNRQRDSKTQLNRLQNELEASVASREELMNDLDIIKQDNVSLQKVKLEQAEQLRSLEENYEKSGHVQADSDRDYQELKKDNDSNRQEMERLQTELNEAKQLQKVDDESNKRETERLKKELQDTNEKSKETNESRQQDIERLEMELRESHDTIKHFRAEYSPKISSLRSPRRSPTNGSMGNVRFHSEVSPESPHGFDVSIADRLTRIRDSAERANLCRSHKRDMSRLKAQHEAVVKSMLSTHEEETRRALETAETTLNDQLHELKSSLQKKQGERLEDVESRFRKEIAEVSFVFYI
jgi:hypothetical protein